MAELVTLPGVSGPQGPFERLVICTLKDALPSTYRVIPNIEIKQAGQPALEYDVIVLAPHALYVVELKEWYGRVTGDDTEWLINNTPKRCPLWLVNLKCKVLKGKIGPIGVPFWVEPLLAIPDGGQVLVSGNWADNVHTLSSMLRVVQDSGRLKSPANIGTRHKDIVSQIQGGSAARRRDHKRRIAGYEIVEAIWADEGEAEYLARRALIKDPSVYRIRTWQLSPYLSEPDRRQREEVIRRPAEAIAEIGRHPNLLQILAFDKLEESNEFYEVTEWSDYGTLHGFLKNSEREKLTLRERLHIARGVAAALESVHGRGLVHRNLCPETILIDVDRNPRVADFDRAYMDRDITVFAATESRRRNAAYVPP